MNRRTELRIVRPLVPTAPREEIDDSIEQLVADRRFGPPLDYADGNEAEATTGVLPLLSLTEWCLLAFITAAGVVGVWIGWSS